MSAQDKEAASREFTTARTELEAAKAKFKKAEARFLELTEGAPSDGAFRATDNKKAPQKFSAGNAGEYEATDC